MKVRMLVLALALVSLPLAALPLADQAPRMITVTGEAEVFVSPDQAVVTLGVESWASDLEAARKDNDARMARLAAVPGRFGVGAADVKTDFVTIEPQYNSAENAPPAIVGYRVAQVLVVRVKNLAQVSAFVGAALGAGANRLDGVQFVVGDPTAYQEKARLAAAADARARATSLAAALGEKVGRALTITEGYSGPVAAPLFKAEAFARDASGPTLAPGQMGVSAQVTVQFSLD